MRDGPHISGIASLIGEPARAEMLTALLADRALTATELADIAGVSKATASTPPGQAARRRLAGGAGPGSPPLLSPGRPRRRATARVADGRGVSHRGRATEIEPARAGAAPRACVLRPPGRRTGRAGVRGAVRARRSEVRRDRPARHAGRRRVVRRFRRRRAFGDVAAADACAVPASTGANGATTWPARGARRCCSACSTSAGHAGSRTRASCSSRRRANGHSRPRSA